MRKTLTNIVFIVLFAVLVISILQMPTEATVFAPAYNDVIDYYLEYGVEDTNATNLVAAILADYRGFDTLGETIVLFTSVVAVASVLRSAKQDKEVKQDE